MIVNTDPDPREIRESCEAIQAGWSESTRIARIADDHERRIEHEPYTVPEWTPDARIMEAMDR